MGKEITATYERDSKRFHRYLIDLNQGITGVIYMPKNEPVPDTVIIRLKSKGEEKKQ